jgi:NTE family protein
VDSSGARCLPGWRVSLGESGLQPDWVAGISIGAINAALIADNAPDDRIEKLCAFWEGITARPNCDWNRLLGSTLLRGDAARQWHNQISAGLAFLAGGSGFFSPRIPVPWLNPAGTLEAMSVFDTSRLKQTLEQLVDFDRINSAETRFSVGAVNVSTGNFVYFHNKTHTSAQST